MITSFDTEIIITGVNGDQGITGESGPNGVDGNDGQPGNSIDEVFLVTVEELKDGNQVFSFNGVKQKTIDLYRSHLYKFDQSDDTNLDSNGNLMSLQLSTTNPAITTNAIQLFSFQLVKITENNFYFQVPSNAPNTLYYYCENNNGRHMGGIIHIISLIQDISKPEPLDFTALGGSYNKVNLNDNTITNQSLPGLTLKYPVSGDDILNGQPLIHDFTNDIISATGINGGVVPQAWKFIGIAANTTSSGKYCNIVKDGFVTARLGTLPAEQSVVLNNNSKDETHIITTATDFKDDINITYTTGQPFMIKFDAGEGKTIEYSIKSFEFNHTGSMHETLEWQYSDNNAEYTTPTLIGFHRTSLSDISGYVFPSSVDSILEKGLLTGTFNSRYIKFIYKTTSSTRTAKWDIQLTPNPNSGQIVPLYTPLYLDPNDYTKVNTYADTNILVGYCAYENADNESIYMRVSTNK